MAEIAFPPIVDLLPQSPPMVLLDRVLSFAESSICCAVEIHPGSMFIDDGEVPAFVGIEYMAQTIAAFGGLWAKREGRAIQAGFLLGGPRWILHGRSFKSGDRLQIRAEKVWGERELSQFQCSIAAAESSEALQEATINTFRPDDLQAFLRDRNK